MSTTRSRELCAALVCLLLCAATHSALAQVRGEIVGPGVTRMPLALPELNTPGGASLPAAKELRRILAGDLEMSGLFRVIDPAAYIEPAQAGGMQLHEIRFENWLGIGARGLIRGVYQPSPEGFSAEVRFFDVPARSMLGGRQFSASEKDVPRVAHRLADAIIELITGQLGPFDTRIAFVSDRGGRFKEIWTYGFDGGLQQVTQHRSVTMAPSWGPDRRSVLFTSFVSGRASLHSSTLGSRQDVKVASKLGLNVGGVWSPDGRVIAVAREDAGNTDIYTIDFASEGQQRLTEHWGIDVDPSWSPDGSRLALCSARSGTPQVYVMGVADKRAQRLTFEGSYNCAPEWSPDGRSIAYAGRSGGRFQIFVIAADGGQARQLTFAGSNEDPSWSPDSRYLVFSRDQGGRKKLFMVDSSGRWEQQLTHGTGDDTSPNWSKHLD